MRREMSEKDHQDVIPHMRKSAFGTEIIPPDALPLCSDSSEKKEEPSVLESY